MMQELRVEPGVVRNKAEDMRGIRGQISGIMESTKTDVTALQNIWESEGASVFQSNFQKLYPDIEAMLSIVDEYVSDLLELATLYQNVESQVTETSSALPNNVFNV